MFSCEFCENTFMSKSGLNFHQRSAKFCLELQGKDATKTCAYCHKQISNRTIHECPVKYQLDQQITKISSCEDEIETLRNKFTEQASKYEAQIAELHKDYQKQISELKAEHYKQLAEKIDHHNGTLTEIAKRSSSTTSNSHNRTNIVNIYTPLDLSEQTVNAILDKHLTTDVIGDGQKGLATMLHSTLLTDENGKRKYKCTDKNRHHFQYMNSDGQIERDTKAIKLTNAMAKAKVGVRALTAVQNAFQEDEDRMNAYLPKAMELTEIAHNNSKFRQQLACLETNGDEQENEEDHDPDADDS